MSWLWKKIYPSPTLVTISQISSSETPLPTCTAPPRRLKERCARRTGAGVVNTSKKCEESKEFHIRCVGKPYRVVQTNTEDDLKALPKQDDEKPPILSIDAGAMKRKMKEALGTSR